MELKEVLNLDISVSDLGLGHVTASDMGLGHVTDSND